MKSAEIHQLVNKPLVVAVSSRALFDLDESHQIFEDRGMEGYREYQLKKENDILKRGEAFPLVRKLLALNDDDVDHPGVDVILLSRNSTDTGLRIFNSIEHYGLNIERAVFTNGESRYPYMESFGASLFLSSHAEDVRKLWKQALPPHWCCLEKETARTTPSYELPLTAMPCCSAMKLSGYFRNTAWRHFPKVKAWPLKHH